MLVVSIFQKFNQQVLFANLVFFKVSFAESICEHALFSKRFSSRSARIEGRTLVCRELLFFAWTLVAQPIEG